MLLTSTLVRIALGRLALGFAAAALALSTTTAAVAQDKLPPMPMDNTTAMKRIAWLVGDWVGEAELAGYGHTKYKYSITWALNKNFLKSDFWMWQNKKLGWHDTGMIGWDKDNNKFTQFVFGLDGTIGTAVETKASDPKATTEKKKLVLDGQTTGNSPWKKFRVVMLKVDDDTMIIDQLTFKDGKYQSMGKSTVKRVKKEKAATTKKAKPSKG